MRERVKERERCSWKRINKQMSSLAEVFGALRAGGVCVCVCVANRATETMLQSVEPRTAGAAARAATLYNFTTRQLATCAH